MNRTTERSLEKSAYDEAIELLLQLHQVIAQGGLKSAAADEIRDAMEEPYAHLDESQLLRLRILSANLYMLNDKEVPRPVPPEQRTKAWLEPRLLEAQQNQDWDTALALLRNGPDYMTPDALAYQRSVAYRNLGHCEIALLFADYAYQNGLMKRTPAAA